MPTNHLPPLLRVASASGFIESSSVGAPRSEVQIHFLCSSPSVEDRERALSKLTELTRRSSGRTSLSFWHRYDVASSGTIDLNSRSAAGSPAVVDFLAVAQDLAHFATQAGLRVQTLSMVNAGYAPMDWWYWDHAGYSAKLPELWVTIKSIQDHWNVVLPDFLSIDVESGARYDTGLVTELHVGLSPIEHLIARVLLEKKYTSNPNLVAHLSNHAGFNFADIDRAELGSTLTRMEQDGWLSAVSVEFDGSLVAARGPLLRRLSRNLLLNLPLNGVFKPPSA